MAYVVPDSDELILRYPAFEAVDETVIEYWIEDAQRIVTIGWDEGDYSPAILALAAHNMARQNIGTTGAGSVGGMAGLTGFRSGSFSANFSEAAVKSSVDGGYESTAYGLEFKPMLRRNRGGPFTTRTCP